jgi:hypothetical protein
MQGLCGDAVVSVDEEQGSLDALEGSILGFA